jgi:hypothetical protein
VKIPSVRIWIEQRGSGATAWAVLVDGEPWLVGVTKREAEHRRNLLEFMASPKARAAARERITGAVEVSDI